MESLDIVLATCTTWPDVSVSDRCLADELTERGHSVRGVPWNDAPIGDFTTADLVVLRSNWDFHHDLDGFGSWLDDLEAADVALHNPVSLVRDHLDKTYIERLRDAGVRTPRTLLVEEFDPELVADWMTANDLDRVVVKPVWGASGHGVDLLDATDLGMAAEQWAADEDRRPMLVQQFVPQIRNGELALVFFGTEYSHSLIRRPASDDFRVNTQYGGTMELHESVHANTIDFAADVLATLPGPITYARIDVVSDGHEHVLMEVEINEPAIGLHLAPGSAARFANALLSSSDVG
ncbi:MAG: ATP-grasp domain-containing protein [Actinomycetota bacterium]